MCWKWWLAAAFEKVRCEVPRHICGVLMATTGWKSVKQRFRWSLQYVTQWCIRFAVVLHMGDSISSAARIMGLLVSLVLETHSCECRCFG